MHLLGQIASALDAAHSTGTLHRDIKPGNIMISPGETGALEHAYLTDFGLSKNVSSDSIALTAAGEFVGTIDYTAPELVLGKPFDSRLDVYSLGCVMYEALTSQYPFPKERDVEVLYAHIQDPPPAASAVRGDLPARPRRGHPEGDGQGPRRPLPERDGVHRRRPRDRGRPATTSAGADADEARRSGRQRPGDRRST